MNGCLGTPGLVTNQSTADLGHRVSLYVRHSRRMDTHNVVDARVSRTSRVRAGDGSVATVGPGKSVSIGVFSRTNERTVGLAGVDRQSKGGGEEGQERDNDSGREDHL